MNTTNSSGGFTLNLGLVTDYIDYITRCVALIIHLVYVLFIIYFKEFKTRSMLFLHHVNIISLIYCIHYVFYTGNQTASFANKQANAYLCYISEIIWINLKFLRLYSLLLLAVYRYTSVFKIQFYRKFNTSLYKMFGCILVVWAFSITMSFSLKYIFQTSFSIYFCYEDTAIVIKSLVITVLSHHLNVIYLDKFKGYSGYWLNSVLFFLFLILFSFLIPSVIVIVLYKKIIDKLKELTKNLKKDKAPPKENTAIYLNFLDKIKKNKIKDAVSSVLPSSLGLTSSIFTVNTSHSDRHNLEQSTVNTPTETQKKNNLLKIKENKNPKQKRFAQQMVLINLLCGIGSVFSLLTNVQVTLSTNPYFSSLNELLQNVSPVFRAIFLAIQSAIPVISIVYSPWSYSWREFKKKINNSDILSKHK